MSSPLDNAIAPSAWGARINYDNWPREDTATSLKYWFLHYPGAPGNLTSGLANSSRLLRNYENYHLSKKWRGIAYDYAIDLSGLVFRLRGHGYSAATSGDMSGNGVPNNRESDAILLLLGNNQRPSDKMLTTLTEVLRSRPLPVYGHLEGKGTVTACPGTFVMAFIKEWRSGRVPRPVPAPESGPVSPPKKSPINPPRNPSSSKGSTEDWTERLVRNLPVLRRGSNSRDVRRLQALLIANNAATVKQMDGIVSNFGPKTDAAVRRFQRNAKITVDGIVGRQTWTSLLGR